MKAELTPDQLDELANDPVGFIEQVLITDLWSKQREIAESVRDHRRTVVRSCHGAGKTAIAARIALWFLYTHPYSNVVTTAPTGRQVKKLLWAEIRKCYHQSPFQLGGNMLPKAPDLTIDDDWMLMGFSTDSGDSFQGWHAAGGVLVILDEAPGMDADIWKATRGIITGDHDRLLAIGNPTEPSGPFYEMFGREDVACHHISAFDVPNVKEERTVIPGLVTSTWVKEMQEDCGSGYETHPDYVARVLGNFPDLDDHVLVPLSWMNAAEERWSVINEMEGWSSRRCQLGVDVARSGNNKTIIAEAYEGLGVKKFIKEPKQSTMETAGAVVRYGDDYGAQEWRIDADGVGAGVYDRCAEMDEEKCREIRGGMRSEEFAEKFANLRAEWYWSLRQRLDPECDCPIALPPDRALRSQLTSIRWGLTSRGQTKIESKDEMRKRGLKSPDEADATVYSMAVLGAKEFDAIAHLTAMTRI